MKKIGFALILLVLVLWHAWMTLSLFGRDLSLETLLDDQPMLSGSHPLHQYHGYLGGSSLWHAGRDCCYDPSFQAGYPKTPLFDCGSRTAELCVFFNHGEYSAPAYKIGVT